MNPPLSLPAGFAEFLPRVEAEVAPIEGQLTPREIRFLALLAAVPTASGEVLEIGSFKGKSTVVLAQAARLAGAGKIVAVDPLTSPSVTDPSLGGKASGLDDFRANLRRAGVESAVEFYQMFSTALADQWPRERQLRLLWIDGDHTYRGTYADFQRFSPQLADGAIIAFHDVLRHYDGPNRVFCENVLTSPQFGAAGIVGSIAWARYHASPVRDPGLLAAKRALYVRLLRLLPFVAFGSEIEGWDKICYKLARFRTPHGDLPAERWLALIAAGTAAQR